ncbi:MAG: serine/threonine protein kinase [Planctomycetota bacterium]
MKKRARGSTAVLDLEFKSGDEKGKIVQMRRTLQAGRYKIKDVMFYGGMGIILRAMDTRVGGNEVLIKAIKYQASEFAFDKQRALYNIYQLRQMFRRERRILCELRSRGINNIPHVNDFFYDQNAEFLRKTYPFGRLNPEEIYKFLKVKIEVHREPYLVMERIVGTSILDRMRSLSEQAILRIVRDVLVVLSKMHQPRRRKDGSILELIYLDVKPQNILVDESGRVTLVDFGGTMPVINGKKRKEQKGALTYGYAAPELETMFTSMDRVGIRADLYSVGALLWYLYSGRDPAALADPISNRFPILSAEELPRQTDAPLRNLVARALERDPKRRWGSAAEMIAILNQYVG